MFNAPRGFGLGGWGGIGGCGKKWRATNKRESEKRKEDKKKKNFQRTLQRGLRVEEEREEGYSFEGESFLSSELLERSKNFSRIFQETFPTPQNPHSNS